MESFFKSFGAKALINKRRKAKPVTDVIPEITKKDNPFIKSIDDGSVSKDELIGYVDMNNVRNKFNVHAEAQTKKFLTEAASDESKGIQIPDIDFGSTLKRRGDDANFVINESDSVITSVVRLLDEHIIPDQKNRGEFNSVLDGIKDPKERDRLSRLAFMKFTKETSIDMGEESTILTTMSASALDTSMVQWEILGTQLLKNLDSYKSNGSVSKTFENGAINVTDYITSTTPNAIYGRKPILINLGESKSGGNYRAESVPKQDEVFRLLHPDKVDSEMETELDNLDIDDEEDVEVDADADKKKEKKPIKKTIKRNIGSIEIRISGDVEYGDVESTGGKHARYSQSIDNIVYSKIVGDDLGEGLDNLDKYTHNIYNDKTALKSTAAKEVYRANEHLTELISQKYPELTPDDVLLEVADDPKAFDDRKDLQDAANNYWNSMRDLQNVYENTMGVKNNRTNKNGIYLNQKFDNSILRELDKKGGLKQAAADIHSEVDLEATERNITALEEDGVISDKMYRKRRKPYDKERGIKGEFILTADTIETTLREHIRPSGASSFSPSHSSFGRLIGSPRILIYKTTKGTHRLMKKYGTVKDVYSHAMSSIEAQSTSVAIIRNGTFKVNHGNIVKFYTLSDITKMLENKMNEGLEQDTKGFLFSKIDSARINMLKTKQDYLFGGISTHKPKIGSPFMDTLKAAYMFSALGGLMLTTLVNDAISTSLIRSSSVREVTGNFLSYIRGLTENFSPAELKVFSVSSEAKVIENKNVSPTYTKYSNIFDNLYAIDGITESGRFHVAETFSRSLARHLVDKTEDKAFEQIKKVYGVKQSDIDFLRDYVRLDKNGSPFIDNFLLSTSNHHNATFWLGVRDEFVNRVIPIHSLTSKSINYKFNQMGTLGSIMKAMAMFKGISIEEGRSSMKILKEMKGLEDRLPLSAKIFGGSFIQGLLYHYIKDLSKGVAPQIHDKDGNLDPKSISNYILRASASAPALGILGSLIDETLKGDPNNALGGMFGYMRPVVNLAHGTKTIAFGEFGRGINQMISGLNYLNPTKNIPFAGTILDRLLIDSARDFAYGNSDKYYRAMEAYNRDVGTYTYYKHSKLNKEKKEEEKDADK